jgi:hypothetical protein
MTRHEWRIAAERAGVRTVEVEIVCSDTREHRPRVASRRTSPVTRYRPGRTWLTTTARGQRAHWS